MQSFAGTSTNFYQNQIGDMKEEEIRSGNLDGCQSLDVIHKIMSDQRSASRLSANDLKLVKLLQGLYKETDEDNYGYNSTLQ
jgi:hypothetical protein